MYPKTDCPVNGAMWRSLTAYFIAGLLLFLTTSYTCPLIVIEVMPWEESLDKASLAKNKTKETITC